MHSSRSQKPSNWMVPPLVIVRTSELSLAAAHVSKRVARSVQTSAMGIENIVD